MTMPNASEMQREIDEKELAFDRDYAIGVLNENRQAQINKIERLSRDAVRLNNELSEIRMQLDEAHRRADACVETIIKLQGNA